MKFPINKYNKLDYFSNDYFKTLSDLSKSIDLNNFNKIVKIIEKNYKSNRNKTFVCGNGGSAALANHYACDHQKILFETKKIKPKIISLCSNTPLITAIANDNTYAKIFKDQLKYSSNKDDILIVISSSGNSANVVEAINFANKKDLITISFTGFDGGLCKKISKYNINISCYNYGIVEATHHSIMNIISQFIKNKLLSKNIIKNSIF
jgi:D-sedoheptulose 7-phosphate isomerase